MKSYAYTLDDVNKSSERALFDVVSLFAGAGGSSTGYRLAGARVLAVNEFIPAAQQAYRKNYPQTHVFTQDIRQLSAQQILDAIGRDAGELDVLDGSPPCATFSVAGLKDKAWGVEKSYSDTTQRTDDLFFEFARVLAGVRPKVFIAENVKGLTFGAAADLLGDEQRDLFGAPRLTIFDALTDAGYSVRYKVLNARDYGVAQSRERVIFIGVRNDIQKQITYPSWRSNRVTVRDAIHDVQSDASLDHEHKALSDLQHTCWLHMKPGESMADYGARTAQKISGFTRIRIDADDASPTVVTDPELFHYAEPRTLKIAEVKRLCSFPDDYYLGDKFVDKWERLGRAVPPFMMKAVAEHVYQTILKDEAKS